MTNRILPCLLLSIAAPLLPGQLPSEPNILFVMSDDQGWGDVGYNGHERLRTPHLDAMAAEGLRVDNFFSAAPVCSPTRASCLTGRHHYRTGVPSVVDEDKFINTREVTIADALRANGYLTAHIGKWHLGDPDWDSSSRPEELGFDYAISTPNNAEKVDPGDVYHFRGDKMEDSALGEDSAIIMDYTLGFIEEAMEREQPFLAYVWMHTPHGPYGSTQAYLDQYADIEDFGTREYYAQITAMDEQIGRLRAALREMGIADNTLIVFCSDNGPNKPPGSTGPYGGSKGGVSDGGLRVPGIIEWPAVITEPRVTQVPMSVMDLYPTFLAAAGIDSFGPARTLDGENVLPVIEGQPFTRAEPIRFKYGGGRGVCYPDGHFSNSNLDPGYAAWETDILAEYDAAVVAKNEIIPNAPPTAVAGADVFATWSPASPTASVTLDGSGSFDTDGSIVSYEWEWDGGSASGASPTLSFPAGRHEVSLTVTDDIGSIGRDTVAVHVLVAGEGAAPWEEANGRVVFEAEAYESITSGNTTWPWRLTRAVPGSVGGQAIWAPEQPFIAYQDDANPVLASYRVHVPSAGSYTLWTRRYAPGSRSDSVNVYLNGSKVFDNVDGAGPHPRLWYWANYGSLELPAGTSTLSIAMRHDGVYLDRFVLASDPDYSPSGEGPPAVSRQAGIGAPYAGLSANPLFGDPPLTIDFDASASSDPEGSITGYTFAYGDGTAPVSTSVPSASHTYTETGRYTVLLTVTDDNGLTTEEAIEVKVGNFPPTAVAEGTPLTGNAPFQVHLDGSASFDEDGRVVAWEWDFDSDGIFEYPGSSVTRTYNLPGVHPVSLRVTDEDGATDVHTIEVEANNPSAVSLHHRETAVPDGISTATLSFPFESAENSLFIVAISHLDKTQGGSFPSVTYDPAGSAQDVSLLVTTPASNPDLNVSLFGLEIGNPGTGERLYRIDISSGTARVALAAYQLSNAVLPPVDADAADTTDTPLLLSSLPEGSAVIDLQVDGSTSSDGNPYGDPDLVFRMTAPGNRGFMSGYHSNLIGDVNAGFDGNAGQGSVAIAVQGIPATPYESWIGGYPGLSGIDLLPDADPNGDGLPNDIAFVQDLPPVGGDAHQKERFRIYEDADLYPGRIVFAMRRRSGPGIHAEGSGIVGEFNYSAEWSNDLVNWNASQWTLLRTEPLPDGAERLHLGLPTSLFEGAGRTFFRLRVD